MNDEQADRTAEAVPFIASVTIVVTSVVTLVTSDSMLVHHKTTAVVLAGTSDGVGVVAVGAVGAGLMEAEDVEPELASDFVVDGRMVVVVEWFSNDLPDQGPALTAMMMRARTTVPTTIPQTTLRLPPFPCPNG